MGFELRHGLSRATIPGRISSGENRRCVREKVADTTISDVITCSDIPGRISGQIVVSERADLWWPVGYGAQPL